jgi:DNA-binding transcriptional MerR regulator
LRDDDIINKKEINMTIATIQEIIKCSNDLKYFGEKCTNIKLYECHKKVLDMYKNNNFVIFQGIRGCGKTLINKIYALHYALFNPHAVVSIVYANNKMFEYGKIEFDNYINNLKFLDIFITKTTDKQISFSNGSTIIFNNYNNPDNFRGYAINLLILEEFAFVKNDNIIDILYPCVAHANSKMIISSSKNILNRKTNRFWKLWCDSIDGCPKCPFRPIYISINDLPNKDEEWKKLQIKQIGKINFDKEYEISYTHSDPLAHDDNSGEKLYTPKEFANIFNVSTSTVARWRCCGKIKGVERSCRKYYYTENDIYMIKDQKISKQVKNVSDTTIFKIDCGNLPQDIVQKYINELNERFRNE